jgi:N,N'-diacetyllegionaminate synthase
MERNSPILIFECANAHGGDFDILKSTIEKFQSINYPEKHIKFQAFHPDTIALPDSIGYEIYQNLLLSKGKWAELLDQASSDYQGIWLDIFDLFGVELLENNLGKVFGIKLQASVLDNYEVFSALNNGNLLRGKYLMLNISGFEISDIERFLKVFSELEMKEIILQIGHQAYPTELKDTGIQKISILKQAFPSVKLCIADHAAAEDDFACIIPLLGLASGCDMIEKHICLQRSTSKYDAFSALQHEEMELLCKRITASQEILNGVFISQSESEYLSKSIQVPVARLPLKKGELISKFDLLFRRTSQTGISLAQILNLQSQFFILNENIDEKKTLTSNQFRKAKIAAVIGDTKIFSDPVRIKSFTQNFSEKLPFADQVLYISAAGLRDEPLLKEGKNNRIQYLENKSGDFVEQCLDHCFLYDCDILIYVEPESLIDPIETTKFLLMHHFAEGADYSKANASSKSACQIYTVEAVILVKTLSPDLRNLHDVGLFMESKKDRFKVENAFLPNSTGN